MISDGGQGVSQDCLGRLETPKIYNLEIVSNDRRVRKVSNSPPFPKSSEIPSLAFIAYRREPPRGS